MTQIHDQITEVDLLVGGTPCQSFSVAGLRKGMADPRGNLALTFLSVLDKSRATWVVWENVPGVLSSNGGRDFGAFLGALVQLGYGFAYRVLDAQHFGVPQRRRRVFVVGYLGDWRRAAAVLFEPESLCRDTAPSREKRAHASCFTPASLGGNRQGTGTLRANSGDVGGGSEMLITSGLNGGHTARSLTASLTATGRLDPNEQTFAFSCKDNGRDCQEDVTLTLRAMGGERPNGGGQLAVAIRTANTSANGHGISEEVSHTLDGANGQAVAAALVNTAVRRLTPVECERLQGFPDDYTKIPWRNKPATDCPDGPRYKALGNSMAVPVMRWIGERIQLLEGVKH